MGIFDFFKKKKTDPMDDEIAKAKANLDATKAKIASGENPEEPSKLTQNDLTDAMGMLGITKMTIDTSPEGLAKLVNSTGDLDNSSMTLTINKKEKRQSVNYGTIEVDGVVLTKCSAKDGSPMFVDGRKNIYASNWNGFMDIASCYGESYGGQLDEGEMPDVMNEVLGEIVFTEDETWVYGLADDGSAVLSCKNDGKYMHFNWDMLLDWLYHEKEFE